MNAPDKVFSKSALEDSLYNWQSGIESNAIEFLIYGLRKKIGQHRIKNIRGLGWYISAKAD
jgi:two-component system response regulator QseB